MDDYVHGAASSLNKSIAELQEFVGSTGGGAVRHREGLRGKLDVLIWKVGRKGFEAGYKAAHKQCADHVEENGIFPTQIRLEDAPCLWPFVSGGITVRSSVQIVKVFKIPEFIREISFWERFKRK